MHFLFDCGESDPALEAPRKQEIRQLSTATYQTPTQGQNDSLEARRRVHPWTATKRTPFSFLLPLRCWSMIAFFRALIQFETVVNRQIQELAFKLSNFDSFGSVMTKKWTTPRSEQRTDGGASRTDRFCRMRRTAATHQTIIAQRQ